MTGNKVLLTGVPLLLFALAGYALAGQVTVPLTGSAQAVENGTPQILLKFDLPPELARAHIDHATLRVGLVSEAKAVPVRLLLITDDWSPSATDLVDPHIAVTDSLSTGKVLSAGAVSLDVTDLVQALADGAMPNRGLMLVPVKPLTTFRLGVARVQVSIFYTPEEQH